jgi:polyisoprenoid-binding protein YceI
MTHISTEQDPSSTTPHAGRYRIDPSQSTVAFKTRHLLGIAPVRGTFTIAAGRVHVADRTAQSSIEVDIDTASFHTDNQQRDAAVRSARFLDTDRNHTITFVSDGVNGSTLSCILSVGATSKPISVNVELTGATPDAFDVRAKSRIDRTDFGITAWRGLAGCYLDITADVRCLRT